MFHGDKIDNFSHSLRLLLRMIDVQQITKRFGRHTAVDDISFSVGSGEIVGFLGPNGAGKTTTLRMLTGFLPPTSGRASINGFDVSRDAIRARQSIGYMPENVPLYEDLRVNEYLKFRGKLKGLSGKLLKNRIGAVLDRCGLTERRRQIIRTLSKGYRQRVGLADALIADPALLILDEPTNGLDPNQIRSIRSLIGDLGAERTILLSTHILSEVEMIASKVIIIDGGRVQAADSPSALVSTMRAAGRVTVEWQADPEQSARALANLKHVKKVVEESTDPGWSRFSVLVDSDTDARTRIAGLAQQHGWALRTLHRHSATLEDVFVELTRKD